MICPSTKERNQDNVSVRSSTLPDTSGENNNMLAVDHGTGSDIPNVSGNNGRIFIRRNYILEKPRASNNNTTHQTTASIPAQMSGDQSSVNGQFSQIKLRRYYGDKVHNNQVANNTSTRQNIDRKKVQWKNTSLL